MVVLDNPTCFTNPFQFEITFECLQELDDDLEWKVLYVGSAQDATRDQILDEILVGPVPVGVNKFVLQADAPDPSQLAQDDLLGVTVVLVTCSYKEREFVRVGYYVNNEYHNPNAPAVPVVAEDTIPPPQLNPDGSTPTPEAEGTPTEVIPPSPAIPNPVPLEHIQRQILADKPRVTKFPISWGDEQPQQQQQQQTEGDTTDSAAASTAASMMAEASSMMAPPPAMTVDNSMMMMQNGDEDNNNDDAEVVSSSGVVSMPEESNMSHSYFGSNHSNGANGGGVQAMAE